MNKYIKGRIKLSAGKKRHVLAVVMGDKEELRKMFDGLKEGEVYIMPEHLESTLIEMGYKEFEHFELYRKINSPTESELKELLEDKNIEVWSDSIPGTKPYNKEEWTSLQ